LSGRGFEWNTLGYLSFKKLALFGRITVIPSHPAGRPLNVPLSGRPPV